MADHHMQAVFSDNPIREITFWFIEDYFGYLLNSGLSSTTAQHHDALLKSVFHEAHRRGIIQEDPMEYVKKPKREQAKVSYYSL